MYLSKKNHSTYRGIEKTLLRIKIAENSLALKILNVLKPNGAKWSQMYAGSMIGGKRVHGLVLSNTVAVYNYTSAQKSQAPNYNSVQRVILRKFTCRGV